MLEAIPGLMNAIRMINSYSRYYNTSERMTALLVKVTNQMINACKAHITDNGYHKVRGGRERERERERERGWVVGRIFTYTCIIGMLYIGNLIG